ESARESVVRANLRILPEQMACPRKRGVDSEGRRGKHRPGCDRPVIGSVGHAARHVAEESPVAAIRPMLSDVGTVACGNAPQIPAVARISMGITPGIFALQGNGALGIFEII